MKKRSIFRHLHEHPEAKSEPTEDKNTADMLVNFLTAEDLRALRDPDSAESYQILELLNSSIH